jgi:putative transposase
MGLEFGKYYHIFNRGNNREILFRKDGNYVYFLGLYNKYIPPVAKTYAYCLLPNHFHFLVQISTEEEQREHSRISKTYKVLSEISKPFKVLSPSNQFSNLFNAYAKAINKSYGRTGSLFQDRFRRKEISSDTYFANLIFYIHFNPQRHGVINDYRTYPFSSFSDLRTEGETFLERSHVLQWFGGKIEFEKFHQTLSEEKIESRLDLTGLEDL